jgi:chemotaxis protein MotA
MNSTHLGIIFSIIAIPIGMMVKGAPITALLNPAAALIIFVGTLASLAMAFPMHEFKRLSGAVKLAFAKYTPPNNIDTIILILEWAQIARREGLLNLESQANKEGLHPFLKQGLNLIIDGTDKEIVEGILETDIEAMKERHKINQTLMAQGGSYAPTLGVLGAVIGLVAALGNMNDIAALGHAIAAAFIATMFGIFTGYVICNPWANKMKRMTALEVESKHIMLTGIMGLAEGANPNALRAKLEAYLDSHERHHLEKELEAHKK